MPLDGNDRSIEDYPTFTFEVGGSELDTEAKRMLAFSSGSEVNRVTVEPASEILRIVVPQLTAIVIDYGLDMDFGEICYPPVTG